MGGRGSGGGNGQSLKNVSISLSRVNVVKSKKGATRGEELRREATVDAFGSDASGNAQLFPVARADSRDRGKTWSVTNFVTGETKTISGNSGLKKEVANLSSKKYTVEDAYNARGKK